MNVKRSPLILFSVLFLLALSFTVFGVAPTPREALSNAGTVLTNFWNSRSFDISDAYLLLFFVYFIIFMAIFVEGIKRIPFFGQRDEISTPGKWFAFGAAVLATVSIFTIEQLTKRSSAEFLQNLVDPFGLWGGFVAAAIIAGVSYVGIKDSHILGESKLMAMGAAAAIGLVMASWFLSLDSFFGWGFMIMLLVIVVGLIMALGEHQRESRELREEGMKRTFSGAEVPREREEKKEGLNLSHKFARVLKRVYRYNKKAIKDFDRAIKAIDAKKIDKAKKELEKATQFEDREIKFDALANRIVEDMGKIPRFARDIMLGRKLKVFNNKLKLDLSTLASKIDSAKTALDSGRGSDARVFLLAAKEISATIVDDIVALEAIAEGLEDELNKK